TFPLAAVAAPRPAIAPDRHFRPRILSPRRFLKKSSAALKFRRSLRKGLAMSKIAKVGVLGASGYTGSECVRLLLRHPQIEITLLTADRRAGQQMRDVFPQFSPFALPKLAPIDGLDWAILGLDLVFCALPHATTQKVVKDLLAKAPRTKVVDL